MVRWAERKREENFWRQYPFKFPENAPEDWERFGYRDGDNTDEDIFYLVKRVKTIRKVVIGDNPITKSGVVALLTHIKNIEYLDIRNLGLDDEIVPLLKEQQSLQCLLIAKNNISLIKYIELTESLPALTFIFHDLPKEHEKEIRALQTVYSHIDVSVSFY